MDKRQIAGGLLIAAGVLTITVAMDAGLQPSSVVTYVLGGLCLMSIFLGIRLTDAAEQRAEARAGEPTRTRWGLPRWLAAKLVTFAPLIVGLIVLKLWKILTAT